MAQSLNALNALSSPDLSSEPVKAASEVMHARVRSTAQTPPTGDDAGRTDLPDDFSMLLASCIDAKESNLAPSNEAQRDSSADKSDDKATIDLNAGSDPVLLSLDPAILSLDGMTLPAHATISVSTDGPSTRGADDSLSSRVSASLDQDSMSAASSQPAWSKSSAATPFSLPEANRLESKRTSVQLAPDQPTRFASVALKNDASKHDLDGWKEARIDKLLQNDPSAAAPVSPSMPNTSNASNTPNTPSPLFATITSAAPLSPPNGAATLYRTNAPVGSAAWMGEFANFTALSIRDKIQQAEIHVEPAELGPITLKLSLDGDSTILTFAVTHADTRMAIESNLPRLKEALEVSGLRLADASVGEGSAHSNQTTDEGRGNHRSTRSTESELDRATAARERGIAALESTLRLRGVIDTFA